jgi:hypothetical protein
MGPVTQPIVIVVLTAFVTGGTLAAAVERRAILA